MLFLRHHEKKKTAMFLLVEFYLVFLSDPSCRQCDDNADCVFDTDRTVFRCICKPGFTGRGTRGDCAEICKFQTKYLESYKYAGFRPAQTKATLNGHKI